jgi:hypothetical protein
MGSEICSFIVFGILVLVVVGLIGTVNYVKIRNLRRLYRNTTCLLVNHTCIEEQYEVISMHSGRTINQRSTENLSVSYSIWNGTEVASVLIINRDDKCDQNMKVKNLILSRTWEYD